MSTDAEAGREILLGNRQLLSIFIIVVILLVAFFTMGYVLGKNTAGNIAQERVPAAAAPASGFGTAQQPREMPASSEPVTPPPVTQTAVVDAPKAPEPLKPATPPAVAAASAGPAAGQVYLQVAAAKRPDAELVSGVLRKKGFRTVVAPGPTNAVFRVLVGPLVGADAIAKARAELETLRFKPILRKY
jgi:cell division protein FtsN